MKVEDFGGMLETSSLRLLQEFDITPERHHHGKMQSCKILSMIPRYAQNSNLVNMSLIGNFGIWEDSGIFAFES